jgi:hypothetical protein
MDDLTITINPMDTIKKSLTIVQFPDGNELITVKKSMRQTSELIESCRAAGVSTYKVEDKS